MALLNAIKGTLAGSAALGGTILTGDDRAITAGIGAMTLGVSRDIFNIFGDAKDTKSEKKGNQKDSNLEKINQNVLEEISIIKSILYGIVSNLELENDKLLQTEKIKNERRVESTEKTTVEQVGRPIKEKKSGLDGFDLLKLLGIVGLATLAYTQIEKLLEKGIDWKSIKDRLSLDFDPDKTIGDYVNDVKRTFGEIEGYLKNVYDQMTAVLDSIPEGVREYLPAGIAGAKVLEAKGNADLKKPKVETKAATTTVPTTKTPGFMKDATQKIAEQKRVGQKGVQKFTYPSQGTISAPKPSGSPTVVSKPKMAIKEWLGKHGPTIKAKMKIASAKGVTRLFAGMGAYLSFKDAYKRYDQGDQQGAAIEMIRGGINTALMFSPAGIAKGVGAVLADSALGVHQIARDYYKDVYGSELNSDLAEGKITKEEFAAIHKEALMFIMNDFKTDQERLIELKKTLDEYASASFESGSGGAAFGMKGGNIMQNEKLIKRKIIDLGATEQEADMILQETKNKRQAVMEGRLDPNYVPPEVQKEIDRVQTESAKAFERSIDIKDTADPSMPSDNVRDTSAAGAREAVAPGTGTAALQKTAPMTGDTGAPLREDQKTTLPSAPTQSAYEAQTARVAQGIDKKPKVNVVESTNNQSQDKSDASSGTGQRNPKAPSNVRYKEKDFSSASEEVFVDYALG